MLFRSFLVFSGASVVMMCEKITCASVGNACTAWNDWNEVEFGRPLGTSMRFQVRPSGCEITVTGPPRQECCLSEHMTTPREHLSSLCRRRDISGHVTRQWSTCRRHTERPTRRWLSLGRKHRSQTDPVRREKAGTPCRGVLRLYCGPARQASLIEESYSPKSPHIPIEYMGSLP